MTWNQPVKWSCHQRLGECQKRNQPGEVVTGFLSPHKNELKSETDAGKQEWFIENESTLLRGKCGQPQTKSPRRKLQLVFIPPGVGNWMFHRCGSFISSPCTGPSVSCFFFLIGFLWNCLGVRYMMGVIVTPM